MSEYYKPMEFDEKLEVRFSYSKEEIENIFGKGFGSRIRGIARRKDLNGNQYIILFRVEGSVFDDVGTKEKFTYFGEGTEGDQKLTASNKALRDAEDDERPIYGFWHDGTKDNSLNNRYEYIGRLKVESSKYEYDPKSGRNVFLFEISRAN